MKSKYRYRFPIFIVLWRWGLSISWQTPIIKVKPPRPSDPEDSMLIYVGLFDDED